MWKISNKGVQILSEIKNLTVNDILVESQTLVLLE